MRKVQLLLLCLLVSVAAFAAEKVIKLPKPNMNRSGSVMNALSERHSTREYAAKALTSADLSDLLWAANGVNRPADGKRTAPSAMNKQDVDVYVVLPQGTYLYDAKAHQLNLVAEGDHRPWFTISGMAAKLESISTTLAMFLAASLPSAITTLQSASLSARTSLTPSPVMATVCFCF